MLDDIDIILKNAELDSKFSGAVKELSDLACKIDKYVDIENEKVAVGLPFTEEEICAAEIFVDELSKIQKRLKRIRQFMRGGLA